MDSSSMALSSPPGSPELRAILYEFDASSRSPPRQVAQRKTGGKMEDYKAHLRAIHDLPISIDLIRGIVEKLQECKNTGALKKSGHLSQAAEMLVLRPPDLRRGIITVGEYLYPSGAFTKDGVFKDKPYAAYVPSLISQCSESSEQVLIPCEWCAMGRGAFASCRVDENHGGCCLNCWHSRSVWDCSLFDKKGEKKPKKKKAAVKTEPQNTTDIAGIFAPIPAPIRKRTRIVDLSPSPEPAPKRVKTIKKPTKRAATNIVAPEPAPAMWEDYEVPLITTSDYGVSQIEESDEMDIDSNHQSGMNITLNRAHDTVTEAIDNEGTLDEASSVDAELTGAALAYRWYEDVINNETYPPWLRESPSPVATTPILFDGTRRLKDAFYAEMRHITTPHSLQAPLVKKRRLTARKITSTHKSLTRQTRPSNLRPIIFTSSECALTGPVPPWRAQIEDLANVQDGVLFQGIRKTSESFYMYFGLAKTVQAKPASALLAVPAFRSKKPPVPASIRASSSVPLIMSRDESRTVPGVTANALKCFARHALSFVLD